MTTGVVRDPSALWERFVEDGAQNLIQPETLRTACSIPRCCLRTIPIFQVGSECRMRQRVCPALN